MPRVKVLRLMHSKTNEPLDNLTLSYSCPVAWNNMDGNERERLCKQCDKKVYNISNLSRSEANSFLLSKAGKETCYSFYLRADGTIKTDNCPAIFRPIRDKCKLMMRACSFMLAFVSSVSSSHATPQNRKETGLGPALGTAVGGIGGGMGQADMLRVLFGFDAEDAADSELNALKKKLREQRVLTDNQLRVLEAYYNQKGRKAKAFLARQASVLHTRFTDSEEKTKLENDRAKVIDELIDSAEKQLTEGKDDEAVKLLNDCFKVAEEHYNRIIVPGKFPKDVERCPFQCRNIVKTMIMSEKARRSIIMTLEAAKPKTAHSLTLKVQILEGIEDRPAE